MLLFLVRLSHQFRIGDTPRCEWILSISFLETGKVRRSKCLKFPIFQIHSGEGRLLTALMENGRLAQVTYTETEMFSKTVVVMNNALFTTALLCPSWMECWKWSVCPVWAPRSRLCAAGRPVAVGGMAIHQASPASSLAEKAYVSRQHLC